MNCFTIHGLEESIDVRKAAAERLRRKGWIAINAQSEDEDIVFPEWHCCFSETFQLPLEAKESGGKYRNTHGVTVGYKKDDQREFLECHRRTDGIVSPNYEPHCPLYQSVTQSLYDIQSRVASAVLRGIAELLELHENIFLDLTDLRECGKLPPIQTKKHFDSEFLFFDESSGRLVKTSEQQGKEGNSNNGDNESNTNEKSDNKYFALSSSVLRICKYEDSQTAVPAEQSSASKVMFGAHTDTSFLTVGMTCTTPGLEILDLEDDEWICPEQHLTPQNRTMILFTGEFLQILTKQYFKAVVHRVSSLTANTAEATYPSVRISCPFLIRGRHEKRIAFHDAQQYPHPAGPDVLLRPYIPDLDETPFGTIHKLLDLKRNQCFQRNESARSNEGAEEEDKEWVLSAYPIQSKHFSR